MQMFFTAYILCSLIQLKLKTEGQTQYKTENLTKKLQDWDQNSRLSRVSLIG